jgi:hypothetical protein
VFRRTITIATLQFFIFTAAGLSVTWPSLNYPWYSDDLHLIRVFTQEELRAAWTQTWDVDGLETEGYRPLTVMFNHTRAAAFGENVAAHRLFIIALFGVYLVLIGLIGRRFGLTPAAMSLAGVMIVCAKYTCYDLAWIADGVHIAQGVAFAVAALAVLRWIESDAPYWWCASVLSFVLAVLIREDSLAIAPVLVVFAFLHSRTERKLAAQRVGLLAYSLAIVVISLAALLARTWVLTIDEAWTAPLDLLKHQLQVVTLAGWHPVILVPAFVLIFALLAAAARRPAPEHAWTVWLWLVCAGVSTAPAVVVSRVNLLLFPITFYCLFVAHNLARWLNGRTMLFGGWGRGLAVIVAGCCTALPALESRRQQLSMAPGSSGRLDAYCQIARGERLASVTPQRRREAVSAELQLMGVTARECANLFDAAGAFRKDVRLPDGVFVAPRRFLSR